MPAKAGIHNYLKTLDSRLRRNDAKGRFKTFYETINIRRSMLGVRCSTLNFFTVPARRSFIRDRGYNIKPLAAAESHAA